MFTMIAHPQPKMPQPGNAWGNTAVSTAHSILQQYAPISLGEMADVALQNRTDTKYLMHTHTLLAALSQLQNEYRVLAVTGTRLNHYQTLYFDTADFDLYQRHHAGALNRYKVRSRVYLESELAFFEVKHKTNKKRTVKSRLQTDDFMTKMNGETAVFLQKHYPYEPGALLPVLGNSFTRITLVSRHRPERLTLDFDLTFHRGQQQLSLPSLAIAEVKREGYTQNSDFVKQMHAQRVRPTSFSKYCLGISYLYPPIKQNNFKPLHLLVQKLTGEQSHGQYN
ncbi:MAG: polyphosphate polymerase domain-containing protein [Anaerolineales bacterium]|nr:polyphosphate polymerase domain-containing protein [Anaerolineales bacterium]MCB8937159.1 polyphosphate polymerase domain-containing protein [Ardenticatenaceae bacterium]